MHQLEDQPGRSLEAAQSLTENETQKHPYGGGRPDEAGSTHEQSPDFEHKGENDERKTVRTAVAERHVQSREGLDVAAQRKNHVMSEREKTENVTWATKRKLGKEVFGKKS